MLGWDELLNFSAPLIFPFVPSLNVLILGTINKQPYRRF